MATGTHSVGCEGVVYQPIARTAPIELSDVETDNPALEIVIMWGERSILHVEHLAPPRPYSVGDARLTSYWHGGRPGKRTTDFLIRSETLGTARLPLLAAMGAGMALVIPPGATGDTVVGGRILTLQELAAEQQFMAADAVPGAHLWPLPPGASARLTHRGFKFVIKSVAAGRRIGVGVRARPDWRSHTWTADFGARA